MIKQFFRRIIYHNSKKQSVILMIHSIGKTNTNNSLSEECFLKLINDFHCFGELYSVSKKPQTHKIVLTFDDGYDDIYYFVFPILREKKIPFTIFVNCSFLNTPGYITTDMLVELSKCKLVTIGSHSNTHGKLSLMNLEEQKNELYRSKEIIEDIICKSVYSFAYPHGQFNKDTIKISKKYYSYSYNAGGYLLNNFTRDKHNMPRINFDNRTYQNVMNLLKKYFSNSEVKLP